MAVYFVIQGSEKTNEDKSKDAAIRGHTLESSWMMRKGDHNYDDDR